MRLILWIFFILSLSQNVFADHIDTQKIRQNIPTNLDVKIQEKIKDILLEKNLFTSNPDRENIELSFNLFATEQVNLESSKILDMEINDYVQKTRRFKIRTQLHLSDNQEIWAEIVGKYEEFTLLPALKLDIQKGDKITDNDIENLRINVTKIRRNTINSAETLLGKVAVRNLKAHLPLNNNDVTGNKIIRKGEMVTLLYLQNYLNLSMDAMAIEDGAFGDIIKIKNVRNNNILYAIVREAGIVEIPIKK